MQSKEAQIRTKITLFETQKG